MASILIPTDFTENSLNGAVYAYKLFGKEQSSYTLLHCYMDPGLLEPMAAGMTPELDRVEREQMATFKATFLQRIKAADLPVKDKVMLGSPTSIVQRLTSEEDYDAVVMGSRQGDGDDAGWLGTHASSILKTASKPVVVVPQGAAFSKLQRILLASDGKDLVPGSILPLIELARTHDAEVIVVHVDATGSGAATARTDPMYHAVFGGVRHTFLDIEGDDVAEAIDKEATAEHVDLVAVLHRHAGFFEGIFHTSVAKRVALKTHTPVMVLQQ